MLGLVVIIVAALAVIAMANWLRAGGGYDVETDAIGSEPRSWKPHDVEPWQAEREFTERRIRGSNPRRSESP
jgi:hypothetical protein